MNKAVEKAKAWLDDPDGMDDLQKPVDIVEMLIGEIKHLEAEMAKPLTYQQQVELRAKREMEIALMRKSHQWVGSQTFADPGRTRMTPYASHCKACGLPMLTFKTRPEQCPKAPKTEEK